MTSTNERSHTNIQALPWQLMLPTSLLTRKIRTKIVDDPRDAQTSLPCSTQNVEAATTQQCISYRFLRRRHQQRFARHAHEHRAEPKRQQSPCKSRAWRRVTYAEQAAGAALGETRPSHMVPQGRRETHASNGQLFRRSPAVPRSIKHYASCFRRHKLVM